MTNKSELAIIVKNNIENLFQKEKCVKKQLAEICGVGPSSVSKWINENPNLPSIEHLYMIAKHFDVTIDWLLSNHSSEQITGRVLKYNQAFIALTTLIDNNTIRPEDINDPVLQYLERHYQELCNSNISQDEINIWIHKILTDYDIPLPRHIDGSKFQKPKPIHGIIPRPDEEAYLMLAKAIHALNL